MLKAVTYKAITAIALSLAATTFSVAQADDIDFINSSSFDFNWVDADYTNQVIAIQNGNFNDINIAQTTTANHHLKVQQNGNHNSFNISHSGSTTLLAEQTGNGNSIMGDLTRDNQNIAIRQTGSNMQLNVTNF